MLPALTEEARPLPGEAPDAYALRAARSKAENVRTRIAAGAADTIVVLDGDILGKPASGADALAMLERLAGRVHTVITACCLWPAEDRAPCAWFADAAHVRFAPWPRGLLGAYTATGDPLDKAGAYGIQGRGAFLADRIEGSWSTVVGLPVSRVVRALLDCGALSGPRA